ncbi:hypothetical protein [uncultured Moraxella sp.]|uniref:hypothetical protein n=1 Tax=uncultured Moraxella sp. TaxID=263769 RepID=UPI0025DCED86|nr:hypothetical protein [uncultured Moraxella sp.]
MQHTSDNTNLDTNLNIKQIANKLLVAILCAASFGAGYYAHQSRQINACEAKGQVAHIEGSVVECVDK